MNDWSLFCYIFAGFVSTCLESILHLRLTDDGHPLKRFSEASYLISKTFGSEWEGLVDYLFFT